MDRFLVLRMFCDFHSVNIKELENLDNAAL